MQVKMKDQFRTIATKWVIRGQADPSRLGKEVIEFCRGMEIYKVEEHAHDSSKAPKGKPWPCILILINRFTVIFIHAWNSVVYKHNCKFAVIFSDLTLCQTHSAQGTEKYGTFRYDTAQVENRLYNSHNIDEYMSFAFFKNKKSFYMQRSNFVKKCKLNILLDCSFNRTP